MSIHVWFRFYEELNDFLPASRRKIPFPLTIKGNRTVREAIEECGVPPVEVDLILVNGKSVDFGYRLKNSDQVSVYPSFETFDIEDLIRLREKPLREPSFILDVHLGKLARYLRLCGFDTLYGTDLSDDEIINLSLLQKRIIVTRDKRLLANKKVTHGIRIRSQYPESQLKEVFDRLDLKNTAKPFTICIECNGRLAEVRKEAILERLPLRTREFYNEFKLCRNCGHIYWEGSHFKRMKEFISIFTGKNID